MIKDFTKDNKYTIADILATFYCNDICGNGCSTKWTANLIVEEIMDYFLDNHEKDTLIVCGKFAFLKNSCVHKILFENGIFRFLEDNKLAKQFVDTKCNVTKNSEGPITFEIESFSLSDLTDLIMQLIEERKKQERI